MKQGDGEAYAPTDDLGLQWMVVLQCHADVVSALRSSELGAACTPSDVMTVTVPRGCARMCRGLTCCAGAVGSHHGGVVSADNLRGEPPSGG